MAKRKKGRNKARRERRKARREADDKANRAIMETMENLGFETDHTLLIKKLDMLIGAMV